MALSRLCTSATEYSVGRWYRGGWLYLESAVAPFSIHFTSADAHHRLAADTYARGNEWVARFPIWNKSRRNFFLTCEIRWAMTRRSRNARRFCTTSIQKRMALVCLLAGLCKKNYSTDFQKIWQKANGPRKKPSDFGGNLAQVTTGLGWVVLGLRLGEGTAIIYPGGYVFYPLFV